MGTFALNFDQKNLYHNWRPPISHQTISVEDRRCPSAVAAAPPPGHSANVEWHSECGVAGKHTSVIHTLEESAAQAALWGQ